MLEHGMSPPSTSLQMTEQQAEFAGILSPRRSENPQFYDWNTVFVLYCDGSSFTGQRRDAHRVNETLSLHFHGSFILRAVIHGACEGEHDHANIASTCLVGLALSRFTWMMSVWQTLHNEPGTLCAILDGG